MGSGRMVRFWIRARRGILLGRLLALGAVLAAPLLAVLGAGGVEGAADHVVAHAGEVGDLAAADQHNGVLLEVVPDARDVGGDLDLAGQADAADLAQRRVGLCRLYTYDAADE